MGAGAAPLDDDQIAGGGIAELQPHRLAAADQSILGTVVQQVAGLGPDLPCHHCGAGGETLHQDLARAVGHIAAVVGANEVAAAVCQQELYIGERCVLLIIRDLRDEQGPQRGVAEPEGDHVLLLAGDVDGLGLGVDQVTVRAFQFLADIGALF